MQKTKFNLSVILPTYNESDNIILLIKEIIASCKGISFEILVIDDNSPDKTGEIVKNIFSTHKNIKVFIRYKRGLASAILSGIRKARGQNICVMDTDFNHEPRELLKMYAQLGKFDLVVGSRYVKGGGMENKFRNSLSRIYNLIVQNALNLPTHDNLSGFFMIKKSKLTNLLTDDILKGYGDYFIRFLYYANYNKLRITEIPVFYKNRIFGRSKSQFLSMFWGYSKTVIELLCK